MVMSLKNVVVPHPRLYFSCRLVQFRGVAFVGKASVYPAHFHTSAASQQFGEANLRHPAAVSSGSILILARKCTRRQKSVEILGQGP